MRAGRGGPGGAATAAGDNDNIVKSHALGGGNGGNVYLSLINGAGGTISLDGTVRGGDGGAGGGAASAKNGRECEARADSPGDGGSVRVVVIPGLGWPALTGALADIVGGNGGSRDTTVISATAEAALKATADTGEGGKAGNVNVPVHVAPQSEAVAGDGSPSTASAKGRTNRDPAAGNPDPTLSHNKSTPGRATHATAP